MPASRRGIGSTLAALVVLGLVTGCALAGTSSPASHDVRRRRCAGAEHHPWPRRLRGSRPRHRRPHRDDGRSAHRGGAPHRSGARDLRRHAGRGGGAGRRACADRRHRLQRGVPRIYRRPRPLDRGPRLLRDRLRVSGHGSRPVRGWTSISEQWVNQERLDELEALAADDALPLRVDAYLALNFDTDFFGDWYTSREPGPVAEHLRVQGLKIHLDNGWGTTVLWEPADLTETIARADEAGWQVSVHAISSRPRSWSSTLSRSPSVRSARTRSTTGSSTPSRSPTSSWPAWSRWTSPR